MNSPNELILKLLFYILMMMIIFLIMNNNISPLNFMLNLFIFTMITLIINYLMTQKSLYCFMIFITMVSGNMIMFLYFTSLINNYYNKMIKKMINYLIFSNLMLIIMTIMYMCMNHMNMPTNPYYLTLNTNMIYKIYEYPLYIITLTLIMYLLTTLLFSMKICMLKYKPLRKIKN